MAENKNINAGHRARLLQRYMRNGLESLEDYEMLELLLHFAIPYRDTKQQAKMLISHFGSLKNVFNADAGEIEKAEIPYVTGRAAVLVAFVNDIRKHLECTDKIEEWILRDYKDAGEYALSVLADSAIEQFYLVDLDPKCKIIYTELISEGVTHSVDILMNKILNSVILHKASQVLLMHNHPNGTANPSVEDITQTLFIEQRLKELGIRISDHIIVAGEKYVSMRNRGFIY